MTQDLVKRLRARAFSSNTATHISVDLQAAADALEAKDARLTELEELIKDLEFQLEACAINDPNLCGGLDKIQEGMGLLIHSKSWALTRARK